ncbi:SpoIID/LytB domain-containing protein [Paenibacillus sp. PAMC21692]|uniref:SpoIID/LytB domain-containing protein n=1 Tax=Paenibacillus sp. PAMC21692 TaxID=2762320 RepID=UPI0021C30BE9|nr:SpoIID/LytB domain-containing protein [Paenibacillus sp. PAMC21692]
MKNTAMKVRQPQQAGNPYRTGTRAWRRTLLLTLAMALLFSTWTASTSSAAVPSLDKIRVALFLSLPGKYDSTTPAATFSSAGGLNVGVREPDGEHTWFAIPAGVSARFGSDDYKAKLFESATFGQALAIYQQVKASGGAAFLTSVATTGAARYQVTEGVYRNEAEAAAAAAKWKADAKLAGLLGAYKPGVQGPFHLETAPLASKKDAQDAAAAFGSKGLDAFVAVRGVAGKETYSVMVGSEPSQDKLAAVQAAAASVPNGAALKAVAPQSRHLIIRRDHAVSAAANVSHELYQFPVTGDMKTWIAPAGEAFITLVERSNRTYRGSFELSSVNGKMAVVNELPFEQYLYSVVAVEMYTSWPLEALKAQAVAARSYALNKGYGFQIAHVVDTTLSQVYNGASVEAQSSTEAVEATAGVVALHNGKVIEAIYSSSAGGMTADATEAWSNSVPYLQPVESPDSISETGLKSWYRVALPSGAVGYIREDLVRDTGRKTEAGSVILESTTDATNIRRHPLIQETVPVVAQIQSGTSLIAIDKVIESNPMNWQRGPFTADELLTVMNTYANPKITGPITSVEVTKRGPSGRATEISVNGTKLGVSSPTALRTALGHGGSLPSTSFEVEQTGKVVVLGGSGTSVTRSDDSKKLYVMGAEGKSAAYAGDYMYVMDGEGDLRAATRNPGFAISGTGYGHGVGLSQYGAYSLATQGYDYEYILQYYYKGITLAKE